MNVRSNEFQWDTTRQEQFSFICSVWNVTAAKRLIVQRPRKVQTIDCVHLRSWVERPPIAPGQSYSIVCGVRIDWDVVDNGVIDLAFPLILVTLDEGDVFVIDGWHRIAKRLAGGDGTDLPGVILNKRETRQVRLR